MTGHCVLVISGPTAAGKTQLGLQVATAIGAQIVSVDSRQVYRRLDIGTAKPTPAQTQQVRHHLLDIVEPTHTFSAGAFARAAAPAIADLQRRGLPIVLVGGSGLYLSAVLDGLGTPAPVDTSVRQALRERVHAEGLAALYAQLERLDPAGAAALSSNDEARILRALELALGEGHPLAGRWHEPETGVTQLPLMICATRPRQELYRRIDARALQMLEDGWIEEVEALLASGLTPEDPGLGCLGYSEVVQMVTAGLPRWQALEAIRRRTRQYAKRQTTWLRRDRRFRWLDLDRLGTAAARDRILCHWEARGGIIGRTRGGADDVDSCT